MQTSFDGYRASVLHMMGITRWVERSADIGTLSCDQFDRFVCGHLNQAKHHDKQGQIDNQMALSSRHTPSALPSVLPNKVESVVTASLIKDDDKNAHNLDVTKPVRYTLEAVRVAEWILVVDTTQIDQAEHHVWLSLKSALSNWAMGQKLNFSEQAISYPMSNEMNHSSALAQKCLDGFILRLQMLGEFTQNIGFLSKLSDGVDYFGDTVDLPSLLQMKNDTHIKKLLWGQITS